MNTPNSAPEVITYRVRYGRFLVAGLVTTQLMLGVFLLTIVVIASVEGSPSTDWGAFFIMAATCSATSVVLLTPIFLLLVFLLPVKVSADTFACPNGFGTMVTVPWGEITRVRLMPIPGYAYLLVSCAGKRLKLWLPLELSRFHEFVEDVGRFAGHDHILYQALWSRVEMK